MKRWAAVFALAVLGVASAELPPTSDDELAICGPDTSRDSLETNGFTLVIWECMERADQPGTFGYVWFAYRETNPSPVLYQVNSRPYDGAAHCLASQQTGNKTPTQLADMLAATEANIAAFCVVPEALQPPEPPAPPTGSYEDGEWSCIDHQLYPEHNFCARFTANDEVEWEYTLPCVQDSGISPDPDGFRADFKFWEQTICPGDEPVEWEPDDPDAECIGAQGLACEQTQRQVLERLQAILEAIEADSSSTPPPNPTPEPVYTVPTFDPLDPDYQDFVVPEQSEEDVDGFVARVEDAVDELVTVATGKFPFGLSGYLPGVTLGEMAACVDFSLTLFGSVHPVGWCGSPVESALAGVGRTAALFLVMLAFAYAVVRTMAVA